MKTNQPNSAKLESAETTTRKAFLGSGLAIASFVLMIIVLG